MMGLMQSRPLLVSSIIEHAARFHADTPVISKLVDGSVHRTTYAATEARARRLAQVLRRLGVTPGGRVGTLAWNSHRHLELYYAAPGMGAMYHTINPRLAVDDIAYILADAEDGVLFADLTFVPLLASLAGRMPSVRHVVVLADPAAMPDVPVAPGTILHCYETLMAEAGEGDAWPLLEEGTASGLCYTSGTTGRPKGVLYSHRSTVLHAMAINAADVFGLRALDRALPVVPMFHVNAWGLPFAAPMAGTTLVMAGRYLDGPSLATLMNEEKVTFAAGVPTVWLGLLQHLRTSGTRLDTVQSLVIGGSACPPVMIEAFKREYGIRVDHAWGMTETSPLGSYNRAKADEAGMTPDAVAARRLNQGRALFGLDMKIVDDAGIALPWDGVAFGNLMVRGHWVCDRYYGANASGAADADGWFATGDVATIDPAGYISITDRSKDVIKSGGEWISSIALENIAVAHPDVAEAAIIAAHHPKWDERPLLLVVAKEGRTIDPAALLASYTGQVAKWWLPDAVLVVDSLPHTATGKLNKLALRTLYSQHLMQAAE